VVGSLKWRGERGVWNFFSTWWAFGRGLGGGRGLIIFFQTCGLLGVDGGRVFFCLKKEWNLGAGLGDGGERFLWFIYGCSGFGIGI
jgi:hypothetical protein